MIGKGKKMAPLHVKTIVALSNLVNEPVRKDKKKTVLGTLVKVGWKCEFTHSPLIVSLSFYKTNKIN